MTDQPADPRLHYLDWLRILALGGVFLFHTMRPFDADYWHVKNSERTEVFAVFGGFLGSWGLAFFFLVAGAASCLALRRRTVRGYLRERLVRLFIPLVVGYLLLSPVQFFIEDHHNGWYRGSFLADLRRMLSDAVSDPPLLLGYPYHLWFVVFLLEFSLLGLPVFHWLRGGGRRFVGWLAALTERRWIILLLIVPVAALHVVLGGAPGADHGWSEFLYYFDFFLLGHLLMSDRRLIGAARRDLVPALALGASGIVVLLAVGAPAFLGAWSGRPSLNWQYAGIFFLLTAQAWGWILATLGLGARASALQRPLPSVVADGAMPFFLVHQPVILAVAYVVVRWHAGIPLKFATLVAVALPLSAALAWLLARLPVISTLFGVKHPRPGRREPLALHEHQPKRLDGQRPGRLCDPRRVPPYPNRLVVVVADVEPVHRCRAAAREAPRPPLTQPGPSGPLPRMSVPNAGGLPPPRTAC